jgi:acyl-CoA-dependent ceramide synthase
MCVWGYTRHYLNLRLLYSMTTTFKTVGYFGEINWETQQYKSWVAQYIGFSLLAALQAVNLFWWFFICRIAYRFIVYKDADDDRSEYEPSEEETEEREKELKTLKEEINDTASAAQGVLSESGDRSAHGAGVTQRKGIRA